MSYKSDIEIAQEATMADIREIAKKVGLSEENIDLYGKYKAKVDYNVLSGKEGKNAKMILVTAINPTPAGEGKTTTTIGVADALSRLGNNT
ncbi:MAG: formate--tetrahydrofolate ligase, partial [Clostridiales bacterium]